MDSSLTDSSSDDTSFNSDDSTTSNSTNSFSTDLASDSDQEPNVDSRYEKEPPTTPRGDPMEQPLYDGADVTVWDSYMLLMQHSLRHSLTKQAFGDLLKVVGMLLPSKSMVSYYRLRKYFLELYSDIVFTTRYCCTNCHLPLQTKEAACSNGCSSTGTEFTTISITAQLKRKFQGT